MLQASQAASTIKNACRGSSPVTVAQPFLSADQRKKVSVHLGRVYIAYFRLWLIGILFTTMYASTCNASRTWRQACIWPAVRHANGEIAYIRAEDGRLNSAASEAHYGWQSLRRSRASPSAEAAEALLHSQGCGG